MSHLESNENTQSYHPRISKGHPPFQYCQSEKIQNIFCSGGASEGATRPQIPRLDQPPCAETQGRHRRTHAPHQTRQRQKGGVNLTTGQADLQSKPTWAHANSVNQPHLTSAINFFVYCRQCRNTLCSIDVGAKTSICLCQWSRLVSWSHGVITLDKFCMFYLFYCFVLASTDINI